MADNQIVSWNKRPIRVYTDAITAPTFRTTDGTGINFQAFGDDFPNKIVTPGSQNIQITTGSDVPGFISETFTITATVTNYGLVGGQPVAGIPYGSRLRFTGPGYPSPSFYYVRSIATRSYSTFVGSAVNDSHPQYPPVTNPSPPPATITDPQAACKWLNGGTPHPVYGAANKPETGNYWIDAVFVTPTDGWTLRSSVKRGVSYMPLGTGVCGGTEVQERSSPITLGFSVGVPAGYSVSIPPKKVVDPVPTPTPTNTGPGGTLGGVPIGGSGGSDDTLVPSTPNTIALSVNPDPISFANTVVGNYLTQTFVIKNHSAIPVTIKAIVANSVLPVADQAFEVGVQYPFTLEPNATKLATMYFIPKTITAYQDIFTIKVQNPSNEEEELISALDFSVDGSGIAGPEPEVPIVKSISLQGDVATSGDIDFLDVTVNATLSDPFKDRELKIINSGTTDVPLRIESLVLSGDVSQFAVILNPIPSQGISLERGATWTVRIRFKPTSVGNKSAIVTIKSDADEGDVDEFGYSYADLKGNGVAEEPLLKKIEYISNYGTNAQIPFGTEVKLNTSKTESFRVKNIGNTTVGISGFKVTYFPPQTTPPFVLGLSGVGGGTGPDSNGVYALASTLVLPKNTESFGIDLVFTPVTVTEFTGYVEAILFPGDFLDQSPTPIQPFAGKGKFTEITPEEPEGPSGAVEPEIPPDEVFDGVPPDLDPGETPGDGYSSACVTRTCAIPYLYKYSVNQNQTT